MTQEVVAERSVAQHAADSAAAPTPTPTASNRWLKAVLASDIAIAFIVALGWQTFATLLGALLLPDRTGFLEHIMKWDAVWYLNILHEHYTQNPMSPAFYPLFPSIVGALSAVTFHSIPYPQLCLLVNTVALGFAIAALLTICREFGLTKYRFVSVVMFLAAPAAIFMHQFYTEAVFVALAFWAYAFALQRRWLPMAVMLAFLTATRLPSLLFVGLCGLEYLRAYRWRVRAAINRNLAYFLLAPAGFLLYGFYLLDVRRDFFAMFSAYKTDKSWNYLTFEPNVVFTLYRNFREAGKAVFGPRGFDNDITVNFAIPLLCLTVLFACSIYLLWGYRGKGIPLGIFGLCSIVFFSINSSLVAVHRYALPCLSIYLVLALIYAKYRPARVVVVTIALAMLVAQATIIHYLYVTKDFVG